MSHHGRWLDCLAAARGSGPAMFGWGLVGASAIAGHVEEKPYPVLDLSEPDEVGRLAGFERFLHHMAHCGLGGEA